MRLTRSYRGVSTLQCFAFVLMMFASIKSEASNNALVLPHSCQGLDQMMRQSYTCSRDEIPWTIVTAYRSCRNDIEVRDRMVTDEQCSAWEEAYTDQMDFLIKRFGTLQGCLKASDEPQFDPGAIAYCRSYVGANSVDINSAQNGASTDSSVQGNVSSPFPQVNIISDPSAPALSGAITRTKRSRLSGLSSTTTSKSRRYGSNDNSANRRSASTNKADQPATTLSSSASVRRTLKQREREIKADPNLSQESKQKLIKELREMERQRLSRLKDGNGLTENELESFSNQIDSFDLSLKNSSGAHTSLARHDILRARIKDYKQRRGLEKKKFKRFMERLNIVKRKHTEFSEDELTDDENTILHNMLDEIQEDFRELRVKKADLEQRLEKAERQINRLFEEGNLSEGQKNGAIKKLNSLRNRIERASSGNRLGSGMDHEEKLRFLQKIGEVINEVHQKRGRDIEKKQEKAKKQKEKK